MKYTKSLNILLPFISLILIYVTMLTGVYISSLNRGVVCPDWPLCPNGLMFPPEKYFYEHFHRLLAIVAAIFTGISLVFIRRNLWKLNKLIILIVTTLIIVQIIISILVISSNLNPVIVAIHLSIAVTIFSLIFVLLRNSYLKIKKGSV